MSTIDVQHGSNRDNNSKGAIGAADAGANVAMQRLNRYGASLNEANPCLDENPTSHDLEPGSAPVGEPNWCAPLDGEVGGAEYSYRVSALGGNCGVHDMCIVSTGTAGEVSRRVQLALDEAGIYQESPAERKLKEEQYEAEIKGEESEVKIKEEELEQLQNEPHGGGSVAGLVGLEEITSSGNAHVEVSVGTNGNLVTSGNTSICGDIQVGIGKKWSHSGNASQCSGYSVSEGNTELPPVSSFIPSNISTVNSDGRITECSHGQPAECQKDTYSGRWSSSQPYRPSTSSSTTAGTISLSGNNTLTVGGGDYWICSLSLSGNSRLIMAEGAHVRFFFDTPENCGTTNQISLSGNNEITATGYHASPGEYDVPGFYLLGSPTLASSVNLSGNYSTTDEFVVYGPNTYVNISGNATFKGIVVGKQIAMSGNGKLEMDDGFEVPEEINPGGSSESNQETEEEIVTKEEELLKRRKELEHFQQEPPTEVGNHLFGVQDYVECSSAALAESVPNAGC
jgi:hypothetical protein